jgi:hypothetical protein
METFLFNLQLLDLQMQFKPIHRFGLLQLENQAIIGVKKAKIRPQFFLFRTELYLDLFDCQNDSLITLVWVCKHCLLLPEHLRQQFVLHSLSELVSEALINTLADMRSPLGALFERLKVDFS